MSSTAAVIALLVAAGEGKSATTQGLLSAAEEALGAGTSIRVFEAAPPSDDAALDVENEVDAFAVVTLVWQDNARLRARTRVHVARTDRWTGRDLTFAGVDTLAERGRALGFAIASMLPEEARAHAAPAEPPRPRAGPAPQYAVGLFAIGATQEGGGGGGALDAATFVVDGLAVRVAAAARYGQVTGAEGLSASDLVMSLAAGLEWWPFLPEEARPVGVGLRADGLLIRHQVYGSGDSAGRFVPGADLLAEIAFRLAPGLELGAGLGIEAAFGKTDVFVGEDTTTPPATTIFRVRAVGELGLRVRF
jgi:hypothetical protein